MTNIFFNNLPVYYINLDKSVERRKYIENHFYENEIDNFTRISAVDGSSNNYLSGRLSDGEFGCLASHIDALRKFYSSGKEYAMICEDDIDLSNSKKFNFDFFDTLSYFSHKYYCLQVTVQSRTDTNIDFSLHKKTFWDFSSAGHIVNRNYAKAILTKYTNNDGAIILDNFKMQEVVDYRGGVVDVSPAADNLIYSINSARVLPIFTFSEHLNTTIFSDDERSSQIEYSIKTFNNHWSNYETISVKDLKI